MKNLKSYYFFLLWIGLAACTASSGANSNGNGSDAYKKISASNEVQRWIIRKTAETPNQIDVKFDRNAQRLILTDNQKEGAQAGNGWVNVEYPFQGSVKTQVDSKQGFGVSTRTVELKFEITEPGSWEVMVYINPDV